jgi:hypothetical protein
MKIRDNVFLLTIMFGFFLFTQPAICQDEFHHPFVNFEPNAEQVQALKEVFKEYNFMQIKVRGLVDVKLAELRLELMKKDRFETKDKEDSSKAKVNKTVREISRLFGDSFKNKVVYYLKAKDVLTQKQCILAFRNLQNFNFEIPDDFFGVVEKELLNLNLDLSYDQVKVILRNRAKMSKKEIDLSLKRNLQMIELQEEMIKDTCDNEKINKSILKISEFGTKQLDNRVVHFIKAKDVLTSEQKQNLFQAMLMLPGY